MFKTRQRQPGEGLRVAIVGATGAVGEILLGILEERNLPIDRLLPLASGRSAGRTVRFAGQDGEV